MENGIKTAAIKSLVATLALVSLSSESSFGQDPSKMVAFSESFNLSPTEFADLLPEAIKGNSSAATKLAFYFEMIEDDLPSCHYFSVIAAKNGQGDEQNNLRILIESYRIKLADRIKLGEQAAEGSVNAAVSLGNYWWLVVGNRKKARKSYEIAARHGSPIDKRRLARVDQILSGNPPSQQSMINGSD